MNVFIILCIQVVWIIPFFLHIFSWFLPSDLEIYETVDTMLLIRVILSGLLVCSCSLPFAASLIAHLGRFSGRGYLLLPCARNIGGFPIFLSSSDPGDIIHSDEPYADILNLERALPGNDITVVYTESSISDASGSVSSEKIASSSSLGLVHFGTRDRDQRKPWQLIELKPREFAGEVEDEWVLAMQNAVEESRGKLSTQGWGQCFVYICKAVMAFRR